MLGVQTEALYVANDEAVHPAARLVAEPPLDACHGNNHFTADDLDPIEGAARQHYCWIADLDEQPSGFLIVTRRSGEVAEILSMAVDEKSRGQGIGTALLTHVMAELSSTGVQLIEVTTLDVSAGYAPYESTHAFWRKRGFVQVDTIDPLPGWRPGNPAAIYIAALTATR